MNISRKLVFCFTLISLFLSRVHAAEPDFAKIFQGRDGCFVLYDLKTDKVVCRYNEARCALRVSPCSTFKIAIALMAFDKGILKDEETTYKWDGIDHEIRDWNRDTSASDWLKYSVVWYSQRITPQLGPAAITNYLAGFDYGNQDISGGLTNFWLGSSLKISANEEIEFLKKLWRNQLPVSRRAMTLTRNIMPLDISPSGAQLNGKTGSRVTADKSLGWFVGHLQTKQGEYVFALNYTRNNPPNEKSYPGMIAEKLCKEVLGKLNLY